LGVLVQPEEPLLRSGGYMTGIDIMDGLWSWFCWMKV
jgi:hypothetical protein